MEPSPRHLPWTCENAMWPSSVSVKAVDLQTRQAEALDGADLLALVSC